MIKDVTRGSFVSSWPIQKMHYCVLTMLKVPFQENVNKNHGKKDRAAFFFFFFLFPPQICECNESVMGLVQSLLKSGSILQVIIVGCISGPGKLCFLAIGRRANPLKISLYLIQVRNREIFFHMSEKTGFGTLNA